MSRFFSLLRKHALLSILAIALIGLVLRLTQCACLAVQPFNPCVTSFIGYLKKAGATTEDIELIAHKNAERLFKL